MVRAHRPQRDVDELPLVPADRDGAEIVRDVSATLDMTRAEEEQDTTEHVPPGQKSEMSRLGST